MPHTCKALLLQCMDFRLAPGIKKMMEEQGLMGDCDLVSLAGAAKNLLDPETQALALKQVGLSRQLHGIKEVHLVNHTDCGAYGGRAAFAGDEAEHRKHADDLTAAAEAIRQEFPDLTVVKWLARLAEQDHGWGLTFEKLE